MVHLEGCTIEDDAMVGNAAMVLHRSVVHSWAVVAANSVVLYDVDVPSDAMAVGSPAVIKPGRATAGDDQRRRRALRRARGAASASELRRLA